MATYLCTIIHCNLSCADARPPFLFSTDPLRRLCEFLPSSARKSVCLTSPRRYVVAPVAQVAVLGSVQVVLVGGRQAGIVPVLVAIELACFWLAVDLPSKPDDTFERTAVLDSKLQYYDYIRVKHVLEDST